MDLKIPSSVDRPTPEHHNCHTGNAVQRDEDDESPHGDANVSLDLEDSVVEAQNTIFDSGGANHV